MPHTVGWFLLWWTSTFLQLCGLFLAVGLWRRSASPLWRHFWLVFACNWLFTLTHQGLGLLVTPHLVDVPDMLPWIMKLGAMGCELMVMRLAQRLARGDVVPRAIAAEGE